MPDFLLELLSEEIPARMQARAESDLACLFTEQLAAAGLKASAIETYSTPRRLALIARDLPPETAAVAEELKGPRASAPPQALEGFLRKTGLARDQLVERDGVLFAIIDKPGRATASVLAEAVPAIVRNFPWPKSMRWGAASISTESPRWVRPLQGIVALLGEEIVEFEIAGVKSGAATVGHRFHHPGVITIGGAHDYAGKLRACHVILDAEERRRIIREGATAAAAAAGLKLIPDEGLVAENAGLTEWPVPLLGGFNPDYLAVPPEVIQLTMRTNQKYFALLNPPRNGEGDRAKRGGGVAAKTAAAPLALHQPAAGPPPRAGEDQAGLAPNFILTANIDAADGGRAIVQGNQRVLSARLADARYFWEQDLKVPLKEQANKLSQITFHEKLGTVADKVERVAKLARWLVEEGIVPSSPLPLAGGAGGGPVEADPLPPNIPSSNPSRKREGNDLATLAETAARLCKADLVTGLVGEFPELQGTIGAHLARAQGHPDAVADAIRDHYKPVGQGDEVPTAPVTVAVSLADKLDTIVGFFAIGELPTGSKDPFALRRAAIGALSIITQNRLRMPVAQTVIEAVSQHSLGLTSFDELSDEDRTYVAGFGEEVASDPRAIFGLLLSLKIGEFIAGRLMAVLLAEGKRPDFVNAVFHTGSNDFLSMIGRAKALQAFVETAEGADLLAGYKRAANILKKEGYASFPSRLREGLGEGLSSDAPVRATSPLPTPPASGRGEIELSYMPENEETALIAALDAAEPLAAQAIADEDFERAMAALATLRAPVDAFFDKVTVNDPDPAKREARLALLARMRDAVHRVADFSRIEG